METFRIIKCWQTKSQAVVFKVQTQISPTERKNQFLVIDLQKPTEIISLVENKPANIQPNRPFVEIFRKHVKGTKIHGVFRDGKDTWLPIGENWLLKLTHSKPPTLELIAMVEKKSLIRMNPTTNYTSPKTTEGDWPDWSSLEKETFQVANEKEKPIINEGGLLPKDQRELRKRLMRKRKTWTASLKKTMDNCPSKADLKRWEDEAKALQANLHLVKEGAFHVRVEDRTIELDPELAAGENLDQKFRELKRAKKTFTDRTKRIADTKKNLYNLEEAIATLAQDTVGVQDLQRVAATFGIPIRPKGNLQKTVASHPYRKFKSSTGWDLLVGRTAHDNDTLLKLAKSQDWWLHAIGASGSHVIIPNRQKNRECDSNTQREAAILALHYSKKKHAGRGDVYLTKRNLVRKKKGLAPGQVTVDRAESIFVSYSEDDLKKILDRLVVP